MVLYRIRRQRGDYSVTSIGYYAFAECYSLASVSLPAGLTVIGEWAFAMCYRLTSVDLPDGVTEIGEWAFGSCHSLTSVTIPDSVTSIGDYAFMECTGLTNIRLPAGLTVIGGSAFAMCYRLTSVRLPDGVTEIGNYAFAECYALTSVSIPESVTSIGDSAFERCPKLTVYGNPGSVGADYATNNRVPFADINGEIPLTIPGGYANQLDIDLERDYNTVSLYVKSLNGNVSLDGFKFFICQYDGNKLTRLICPAGTLDENGYLKYSAALPSGNCKLLYWDANMMPLFDVVVPV
ncbi:MAG: leucine-rich repeat domain-containing protein [Clostridiales bacterium]|nr:leucine-rich repeat domain-containing protein [Clostridiales bacterium]